MARVRQINHRKDQREANPIVQQTKHFNGGSTWKSCKGLKGQIILKGFLMSSISSKKRTKKFDFTAMIPQVDLFSFVFWRKPKTTKKPFRNYLTFMYNSQPKTYNWLFIYTKGGGEQLNSSLPPNLLVPTALQS